MEKNNIPKTIHYFWFGRGKKSEMIEKCISSWKKYCPDYEIKEWNEDNFDVNLVYYTKKYYEKKNWAFVSDYARIYTIYNHGGVYMDTDIELVKNLDPLLENEAFTSFQDKFNIGCSIFGARKGNTILKEMLDFYENKKIGIILPYVFNRIFKRHTPIKYNSSGIKLDNFTIYPKDYFYPYAYFEKPENMVITQNTYCIHHFGASWLPKIIVKILFPIIGAISKYK